jgi:glycosyltransferase involved in cell wall biosynthesis
VKPEDWFLTAELFSEEERPGFSAFLARRPCRLAAIYHDSIPLKFPEITWPKSVARHPHYLALLARFDRVWAVSSASRDELLGFWRWQGHASVPRVEVLPLGADLGKTPRISRRSPKQRPALLSVGILEPRKNQSLLLEVCAGLWAEGLEFDLDLVGRVNPHFGEPIVTRIAQLARRFPGLRHYANADDAVVMRLYDGARVSLMPTLAEGCGLPVLESLWLGVPCVASALPSILENAEGGGCLTVAPNDRQGWEDAIRRVLTQASVAAALEADLAERSLPTWSQAGKILSDELTGA